MPQELKRLAEEYIEAQRGWDLRESLYPRTSHVALDKLSQARSALLVALTPERVVALCEAAEALSKARDWQDVVGTGDYAMAIVCMETIIGEALAAIEAAFEHQQQDSE